MSNWRYTSEEANTFLSMTDESEEEVTHLSDSGSEYEPVDSSGTLTDSSDDGVVVPAKVRRTRPRSSAVVEVQELQGSHTTVQIQTPAGVVEKPLCVHEYNLNMGGVEFNNQLLAPFLIAHKARWRYKKVSVYLFQLALLNAYEEIITALLFPGSAVAQLPNPNAVSWLHEKHFQNVLPGTPTQRNPQRRCRVCRKRGYRHDTRFYCPSCSDQPGICIG
ncbi:hypothetical protein AB205_0155850, partial [Aquarana catesbeiana]